MSIYFAYIYDEYGIINNVMSGDITSINFAIRVDNLKAIIRERELPKSVDKYFINSRNELDEKTEYTGYEYISNVQVGDEISIRSIPFDSEVTWPDGFTEIVTDGFVETTATLEGEYKFIIDHPAYFPVEVIINATP